MQPSQYVDLEIMIAEQRRRLILQAVEAKQTISIAEMEKQIGVTRETLRRDISELEKENLLRQVRGGAVALQKVEGSVFFRNQINLTGKEEIAKQVTSMIPNNCTIVIDSGSTTLALARHLSVKVGLTILTNDIGVAMHMSESNHEVHLIGGRIESEDQSTRGEDAVEMLNRYVADYAFVGVGGISSDFGFTDYSRDAVSLRETMISIAGTTIMLADHTKFGKVAPVRLKSVENVRYVVTDKKPSLELTNMLDSLGIELIY